MALTLPVFLQANLSTQLVVLDDFLALGFRDFHQVLHDIAATRYLGLFCRHAFPILQPMREAGVQRLFRPGVLDLIVDFLIDPTAWEVPVPHFVILDRDPPAVVPYSAGHYFSHFFAGRHRSWIRQRAPFFSAVHDEMLLLVIDFLRDEFIRERSLALPYTTALISQVNALGLISRSNVRRP